MVAPAPIIVTHFQGKRKKKRPMTKEHMSAEPFLVLRIFPGDLPNHFPLYPVFQNHVTTYIAAREA